MTTTLAVLLLVNAVWNAVVWPQFYRRVSRDARARDANGKATAFLKVHAVLIGISLLIALASLIAAIAALAGAW
ncbi:SCO4848 family membrane protein [Herbiconiux sp. P15]|uniref:SCO4848 family membrane protein n=1 Tax=Herbiconiux liukaitaii TaxID=3342799 RepID=UPI0035B94FB6